MMGGSMVNLNAPKSAKVVPATEKGKVYRRIVVNDPVLNAKSNNEVRTSKYTIYNFLVKSLFEQFRRLANLYFLIISALQLSTSLSPTSKYSTVIPLVGVLFVTMLKEIYEDYYRHKADHRVNHCTARVLRRNAAAAASSGGGTATASFGFTPIPWHTLKVGDIVSLRNKEPVPADIILLAASSEQGVTYIETANLDGETNLKLRQSIDVTQHLLESSNANKRSPASPKAAPNGGDGFVDSSGGANKWSGAAMATSTDANPSILSELSSLNMEIECDEPNEDLYEFEGNISIDNGQKKVPVSLKNVVWRGATIMNTAHVYGVVVFTGQETRLIKNSRATPSKRSNVDRIVNTSIMIIFVAQALLCTASTLLYANWVKNNGESMWYLPFLVGQSQADTAMTWVTFFILYNNLVPISLYVSLEFVKLFQARLINSDRTMYYAPTDTPAMARTSNLNEDLGQVQYVFSDKTGTLTCNQMEFHRCSIGGIIYGAELNAHEPTTASATHPHNTSPGAGGQRVPSVSTPNARPMVVPTHPTRVSVDGVNVNGTAPGSVDEKLNVPDARGLVQVAGYNFDDRLFLNTMRQSNDPNQVRKMKEFLTVLAICHSVMPERDESGGGGIVYKASSPDDGALVEAARQLGFEFYYRDARGCRVKQFGVDTKYEILNLNAFTSDRRCMSVIVRQPDGKIVLYAKGADEVILPNLRIDVIGSDEDVTTQNNLAEFASAGLRTLVMGRVELDPNRYAEWNLKFQIAAAQLANREKRLAELAMEIEKDYELIGATAIEDKLQDGVPDTIQKLGAAGIRVWMLTGDKLETAQNIGYSCKLLTPGLDIVKITESSYSQCASILASTFTRYKRHVGKISDKLALMVTGKALTFIFGRKDLSFLFLQLCKMARVVIACRVIPAQKAEVVRMVRSGITPEPMTLAIGDGANDVSMIQEAHVGVGISGNEGMQAVRASDYSIAQFKYLERLLLVHGRWDYMRVCFLILYSFYKNITYVLTLFYYGFVNGFSGTTLYESYLGAAWNVAFTFVPVLLYGIVEQDVSASTALKNPFVYMSGGAFGGSPKVGDGFSAVRMGQWALNAVMHSLIIFGFCFGTFEYLPMDMSSIGLGADPGLFLLGSIVNFCTVLTVTYKISLETKFWTVRSAIGVAASVLIWFIFVLAYSSMSVRLSWDYWGIGVQLLSMPLFWLLSLLVPVTAILIDFVWAYIATSCYPSVIQIVREREALRREAMRLARGSTSDEHETPDGGSRNAANEDGIEIVPLVGSAAANGSDVDHADGSPKLGARDGPGGRDSIGHAGGGGAGADGPNAPLHKQSELIRKIIHLSNVLQGKVEPMKSPRGNDARLSPQLAEEEEADGDNTSQDEEGGASPAVIQLRKKRAAAAAAAKANKATVALTANGDDATGGGDEKSGNPKGGKTVHSHWLTLRFTNHPELEAEYHTLFVVKSIMFARRAMSLIFGFLILYAIISAYSRQPDWLLRVIVTSVGAPALSVVWTNLFLAYYVQFMSVILCAIAVLRSILITGDGVLGMGLFAIIIFLVMRARFIHAAMICALDVVVYTVWMIAANRLTPWEVTQIVLLHLLVCTFCGYVCWSWEKSFRRDFLLQKDYELEQEHTQSILNNMLPSYITKTIKKQLAARDLHLKRLADQLKQQKGIPSARGERKQSDGMDSSRGDHSIQTAAAIVESLAGLKRTLSAVKTSAMSPLLKNLKELSEQGIVIANEENSVSILFCDMMDFSRFVATHPPGTVVAILDAVYSTFDELCVKNGIQKMETVGKTYMCAAGLHGTRKDHAHAVAEMAEEMIALMKRCVDKNGLPIEVRVGIHTGKVLSGVVGLKRPQYSLFGDTVNTSSRIQSTGEAGKIHLSAETYAFLKKDYRCVKRRVQAKGKGWLTTYFLGERVTRIPMNRKIAYREDQDDITQDEIQKLVKSADPFALNDVDPYQSGESGGHAVETHPVFLSFTDKEDEREFRKEINRSVSGWSRRPLWMACVYYALEPIFFYFANTGGSNGQTPKTATVDFGIMYAFVAICGILTQLSTTKHFIRSAEKIMSVVFACGLLAILSVPLSLGDQTLDHRAVMSYIFCVTLISNSGVMFFFWNIVFNVASVIAFFIACHGIAKRSVVFTNGEAFQMDFFVAAGAIINLIASYGREYYMRREFVLTYRVRVERDKAEAFLYQMIPRQVAQDLKRGISGIASKFENVTILYSDIKGFTKYSASSTPEQVVQLLSKLFSQFDLLTDKLHVYKVQTIGDAYVLVGGFSFMEFPPGHPVPTAEDSADYVCQMAFEMHKTIKQVKTAENGAIEMRIGIHTGEVIAGIIGTKQLRYDIWGTDCLVANTMESNGVPSGIVVSGSTAKLIRNRYELLEGPIVQIKGRDAVQQFVIRCPVGRPEMTLATQFPIEEHAPEPTADELEKLRVERERYEKEDAEHNRLSDLALQQLHSTAGHPPSMLNHHLKPSAAAASAAASAAAVSAVGDWKSDAH